jgi:hypothetical protein
MDHILFGSWSGLGRVASVGVATFVALVLMVRVSGRRSLAELNAFDLVVTLAEGVVALVLLLLLPYVIAWAGTRSGGFNGSRAPHRRCCTTRIF